MDRDRRNIAMGLGSNTYAAATIISYQGLAAHFRPNYRVQFDSQPFLPCQPYFL
jgi:hypothetical protein